MKPEEKEAAIQKACQLAQDYERDYGCCPQCVLAAVKETVGIVTDDVIKASHGLSGGGGLTGIGYCGALAGGLLAIGCQRGRELADFPKGKFIGNFQACKTLLDRFSEKYGTLMCEGLQQQFTGQTYDFWNADEFAAFKKARGEKCSDAIADITRWTLEIMLHVT
jgi:C_GCAxxG_C_C family probable redox protein